MQPRSIVSNCPRLSACTLPLQRAPRTRVQITKCDLHGTLTRGDADTSSHFTHMPCCIGNPCVIAPYHSSNDLRRAISQSVSATLVQCLPSIPRRTRSSVTSREFSGYLDASLRATPTSCCARSSHISHRSNRSSSVRPTTNLPSISRPASFGRAPASDAGVTSRGKSSGTCLLIWDWRLRVSRYRHHLAHAYMPSGGAMCSQSPGVSFKQRGQRSRLATLPSPKIESEPARKRTESLS